MAYIKQNWQDGDIITADKLNHIEDGIASGEKFVEITYSALKALRDSGELIKGTQYKITDYVCTSTDENTQVESHPFDIIVVADSESVLNENARACMKADDSYYHVEGQTDAVLSAWELKYCIDNDTSRFAWADETNGKGVIFYMKDDRGNECPYDFKNIKFKRFVITAFSAASSLVGNYIAPSAVPEIGMTVDEQNPVYLFTFWDVDRENDNAVLDSSIKVDSWVFGNVMNKKYDHVDLDEETGFVIVLNDNVFAGWYCHSNTFGYNCFSNTFGYYCFSNTFEDDCHSNTFGFNCFSNTFGFDCYSNTFGDDCYSNTFGYGCYSNTFGNGCNLNTFGDNCYSNTFGGVCFSNTFGDDCKFIDISTQNTKYYRVLNGVAGNGQSRLALTTTASNYHETYVGKNSSGVLKYYCPMDSAS